MDSTDVEASFFFVVVAALLFPSHLPLLILFVRHVNTVAIDIHPQFTQTKKNSLNAEHYQEEKTTTTTIIWFMFFF